MKKQYKELIEHCAQDNPRLFNKEKAEEEAIEFLQAIVKRSTKDEGNLNRPTKEDIVEEFSHTIFRGYIYLCSLFPDNSFDDIKQMVNQAMIEKMDNVAQWKKDGKYSKQL